MNVAKQELPATARAARLRPGERPTWWDASADGGHFAAWRAAAAAHGLSVDVLIALLLEFDLVLEDLAGAIDDPAALLASTVAERDRVVRLRLPRPLRDWPPAFAPPADHDELPELILPERLAARLGSTAMLHPRVRLDGLELARACDRRAALAGRTLESWALRVALDHVARGSADG